MSFIKCVQRISKVLVHGFNLLLGWIFNRSIFAKAYLWHGMSRACLKIDFRTPVNKAVLNWSFAFQFCLAERIIILVFFCFRSESSISVNTYSSARQTFWDVFLGGMSVFNSWSGSSSQISKFICPSINKLNLQMKNQSFVQTWHE